MNSNPYEIGLVDPTHPPYAIRRKMLVRTMHLLSWDRPILDEQPYQQAEQDLLNYALQDSFDQWSVILSDQQLNQAITGVKRVLSTYGSIGYVPPDRYTLTELVQQLTARLPPIIATLSSDGTPQLRRTDISHTLYAGWIYSIGASRLTPEPLPFLETNMLCDHALLQQRAINISIEKQMQ
jgi:hypothetical protein